MNYALKIVLLTRIKREDFKLIHNYYFPNKNINGISNLLLQDFSEWF